MVASVMRVVGATVSSLDADERRRLETSVDFGAKDVSDDDAARIVTDRGAAELNGKLRQVRRSFRVAASFVAQCVYVYVLLLLLVVLREQHGHCTRRGRRKAH